MNSFSHKKDPKVANRELGRKSLEEFKKSEKTPLILILDNVRSLHNVGSVFRSADAFAVEKIYLCGITAKPPHREITKTAIGATESVDWEYLKDSMEAVERVKQSDYSVFTVEQTRHSIPLDRFQPRHPKIALIFGHEVKGVQQVLIDQAEASIEIPQLGTKHSFNISVSAGIVLWDIYQKIKLL